MGQDERYIYLGREMTSEELAQMRKVLAARIAKEAIVRNSETGYVFCPEVNWVVNPEILLEAARVAKGLFLDCLPPDLKPQKVIGVPNRGKEFATAMGLEGGLPIAITERILRENGDSPPIPLGVRYSEEADQLTIGGVPSFTKGKQYDHFLFGVRPGETVMIVDDFCAYGKAANSFLDLKELGINPVFVFLVAKDFSHLDPPQIGYRELKQKAIPAFAVVRFTGIKDGKVIATAEDI